MREYERVIRNCRYFVYEPSQRVEVSILLVSFSSPLWCTSSSSSSSHRHPRDFLLPDRNQQQMKIKSEIRFYFFFCVVVNSIIASATHTHDSPHETDCVVHRTSLNIIQLLSVESYHDFLPLMLISSLFFFARAHIRASNYWIYWNRKKFAYGHKFSLSSLNACLIKKTSKKPEI